MRFRFALSFIVIAVALSLLDALDLRAQGPDVNATLSAAQAQATAAAWATQQSAQLTRDALARDQANQRSTAIAQENQLRELAISQTRTAGAQTASAQAQRATETASANAIATAQMNATQTASANATATAQMNATQTAQANATATTSANATATTQAQAIRTAQAQQTETAQANATATTSANATATRVAEIALAQQAVRERTDWAIRWGLVIAAMLIALIVVGVWAIRALRALPATPAPDQITAPAMVESAAVVEESPNTIDGTFGDEGLSDFDGTRVVETNDVPVQIIYDAPETLEKLARITEEIKDGAAPCVLETPIE